MRKTTGITGETENIFKKIRVYLGMSIEEIAREVGVSNFTWWRWESGVTDQPTLSNVKKIVKLVKKKANEEFKKEFLKWVIYNNKISTFGKTEKEIVEEIEKIWEQFCDSPILKKVLEENPDLKGLPFREVYNRYTKGKLSYDGVFLLNSLPANPPERGRPKKVDKKLKQNNNIKRQKQIKKTPRERHRSRNKNFNEDGGGEDSEESDGKPPNEFDRDLEAKYNLIRFFDLLLKIDMKINQQ